MNTVLRKKEKNIWKDFFNLMDNVVFRTTMENRENLEISSL